MREHEMSINEKRLSPTLVEFTRLRGACEMAMVTTEVSSDLHTPVSAFMRLDDGGPSFLLESAESDKMWGRYSFLGFEPRLTAGSREGTLTIVEGGTAREVRGNPVRGLVSLVEDCRVHVPDDDMPFSGGAVGFFGYEVIKYLEKVHASGHPVSSVPELMFMLPGRLVAFDHLRSRIRLCTLAALPDRLEDCRASYAAAVAELEEMMVRLQMPLLQRAGLDLAPPPGPTGPPAGNMKDARAPGADANMTGEDFERMVSRAREYILAGDAFQVVVSARFGLRFGGDPLSIYRYLRAENPSPYMFYIRFPGLALVGSSPEPMVTNRGGRAVIRPIAGTRPRGATSVEDAALADELAADPKEKAEHIMLVDLARNDLGRVCVPGTIRVTRLMEVENYSHVMHMVSEVSGTLRPGQGNYELLRAAFPAGTVSGAPKVRACEIIDELEPEGRGPYAGAIGYLGYSGDMDTCIAIRTALVAGGVASVQAGAGIVADSVPESEWNEALNKAGALVRAIRAAGGTAGDVARTEEALVEN
jgi:anthranilate synthase component I